ncbi:hypothetical protein ASG31_01425 [Chryseobacterium sp. Leaf404]|uniref:hypothetical protein n=1 Tax=unclassified Chryseobacterium TaxID=2593645 RepID=UPI0006FEE12F|nr:MULTISPECIES: hypothetical protein [unclassified Chryseobacterium]KQT22032.1 hypothetical protein ASG31_01425 [Chryseobacterium sp. Leaf404]
MKNIFTALYILLANCSIVFGKSLTVKIDTLHFHDDRIVKYENFESKLISIQNLDLEIPKENSSFIWSDNILTTVKQSSNLKTLNPTGFLSKLLEEKFLSKYKKKYQYRVLNSYLDSEIQAVNVFFHADSGSEYSTDDFILLFVFKESILKSITQIYNQRSGLGAGRELKIKHFKDKIFSLHDALKFSDSSGDQPQTATCKFMILSTGLIRLQKR